MLRSQAALGVMLGVASAVLGGAWQVLTRQSTTAGIAPDDLAVLRYGIPALVLLPITWRMGLVPRGASPRALMVMVVGAGLPFGLVAMSGTRFAPAAHMGVLMAGAMPLMATALAWALWRERVSAARAAGLLLMALGVGALASASLAAPSGAMWLGDSLFLLAAAMWAGFTLAFRHSGLTPWQGAAFINTWSALALLPWLVWHGAGTLWSAPLADIALQALWQGVLAGLLGLWTFSATVARLGAANGAAFGALIPVVSALGGWWLLGDPLTRIDLVAVLAATLGVLLASGTLAPLWRRWRSTRVREAA